MADIHLSREHALGLPEARKIAFKWAEQVEKEFDMACTYEEGTTSDRLSFSRSGVQGTLNVTANEFEISAQLGFLVGIFKEKIEAEIIGNLDALMAQHTPAAKKSITKNNVQ